MQEAWDWTCGEKVVQQTKQLPKVKPSFFDHSFSPDGERVATIVFDQEEMEFQVVVNGVPWEHIFENIWLPQFTPQGKLTILGASLGEWTLVEEDEPWPEQYEYIWKPQFDQNGKNIAAAIRKDGRYGMAKNGQTWEKLFHNATGFCINPNGDTTACIVQTEPLDQGDIQTFRKGIFSVAVNGKVWDKKFQTIWDLVVSDQGKSAAVVRLNTNEYSIAVDGSTWEQSFAIIWRPQFNRQTEQVLAPVRVGQHWGLAIDGALAWEPNYKELWHLALSDDGQKIWAIGAPKFGRFTLIKNNRPWKHTFPVISEFTLSPDGEQAMAIGQVRSADEKIHWQIILNDIPWAGLYDQVYHPTFSPDNAHAACTVQKGEHHFLVVDNKILSQAFQFLWKPTFSPDSTKILIKGFDQGKFIRKVLNLKEI